MITYVVLGFHRPEDFEHIIRTIRVSQYRQDHPCNIHLNVEVL